MSGRENEWYAALGKGVCEFRRGIAAQHQIQNGDMKRLASEGVVAKILDLANDCNFSRTMFPA